MNNSQPNKQALLRHMKRYWKPLVGLGLAASFTVMSGAWAGSCTFARANSSSRCDCNQLAVSPWSAGTARVGNWNHDDGAVSTADSVGVNICTDANDSTCSTTADVATVGAFTLNETKYFANTTVTPTEYFKCTYTKSGISGNFAAATHAPPLPPPSTPAPVGASASSIASLIFLSSALLLIGSWASRKKVQKDD